MTAIRVGIGGATGYLGTELLRMLLGHPHVKVEALASANRAGKHAASAFPAFSHRIDHVFRPLTASALSDLDVVLLAAPHGVARELAPDLVASGVRVIDLSGDHRLSRGASKKHYGAEPIAEGAVYGLPELNAPRIRGAKLVANPGCYPTASALALLPLVAAQLVEGRIVVDAVSGVSGAGKEPSADMHFPEMNESARAYKVGSHRHEPEIAETLSGAGGFGVQVAFTPHVVPMNRGILATTYAFPRSGVHMDAEELTQRYQKQYADEPFVRVVEHEPDTKHVRNSNFCDVKPHLGGAGMIVVTSAIDNLVKGGAGQAVENMNIMFDLPRTAGLPTLGGGP